MIVVHDENGMILFVSTYHAGEDYEQELSRQGYRFVHYDEPADAMEIVGTCFVDGGNVKPRPTISVDKSEVTQGNTISIAGLPDLATVTVDGVTVEIDDGELALHAEHLGQYDIQISAWPCMPFHQVVTVR
ncbi:hypothetical protein GJU93_02555 [Brucella sp. 10RB9212]|uniref:hypothetical protein n=1 Tax=unclassified Brucella TaxID=2632610 RepID=UPI000972750A|nr:MULTISPECIES: hypothetical protein [unclassified Brucella]APY14328.1 hypothetical protein BKD02_08675 [Brucella sp. 09RB8910]MRN45485.1 hypothetical protein [Brucella sp. 10RB9212]